MTFTKTSGPREPSPWVLRWAHLAPPGGTVLDLAAGDGRHGRIFLARGHHVTFVDKNTTPLADVAAQANASVIGADLEDGAPWPLAEKTFDVIVVTNYLYRPLFAPLIDSLKTDGVLLYETFAHGNEAFRRPRNPAHLLKTGELLAVVQGKLQVVAYEHGLINTPDGPAVKQRLCAHRGLSCHEI